MEYKCIEYLEEGRLATIKLNRPDVLNALNADLISELNHALNHVSAEKSIGGVLLTGNGRAFCAGADLNHVNTDKDPVKLALQGETSYQALIESFNPIIQTIHDMEKPVVAAVNGVAAGFGVSIALVCDLVYASESASFIQVFVPQLGVIPDGGSTWMLPRLISNARAKGMILTGKKIKARQAEDWGMIWECLPEEELMHKAHDIAFRLAHGPTLGIGSTLYAMKEAQNNTLEKQLRLEAFLQKTCCGSEDFAEGAQAFIQMRKPNFIGK